MLKKYLPYSLVALLAIIVVLLLIVNSRQKTFDKRVSLSYKQEHPYGLNVLYQFLPLLLPNAKVEVNRKSPGEWYYQNDSAKNNTLFMVVTQHFNPSQSEIELLDRFVQNGNSVFIVSPKMNEIAKTYFNLNIQAHNYFNYYGENYVDSPIVYLKQPVFAADTNYLYPGFTFDTYLEDFDSTYYAVLGTNDLREPNFVKASIKNGTYFLHTDPFMFTNYFLLHKKNINYLEKSFALIPPNTQQIIWDEYFIYKLNENEQAPDPSPLRILLSIQAFKWAFALAVIALAIYLILNSKRNQRFIPVIEKNKNESLDFVKTIGRLYFEKQDHANIANKMCTYFLEHVRSKYFINTSYLNEEFIQKLSGKSGLTEEQIRQLVQTIQEIQLANTISQHQLSNYYSQFNQFYKNTA